jgi:hypothetical protein
VTVKDLLNILTTLPSDTKVVAHGYDPVTDLHAYREIESHQLVGHEGAEVCVLNVGQLSDDFHTAYGELGVG